MAKKGLTLEEKRAMIQALFNSRNQPVEDVSEAPKEQVKAAPKAEQNDEEEEVEKEYLKKKNRYKKQQQGRLRPRGRR